MKDALGDRMKKYYEDRTRINLPRRTYTIIRVDGKAFHTFTRGLKKPFDEGLINDMDKTACYLCKNIQGTKFAFVQSDEISILLTDFDEIATDAWFDGNIQKMTSVAARYVRHYAMDGTISNILKKEIDTHYESNYDVDETDNIIENILGEEKKRARDLLNKHITLYKVIVKHCIDNNDILIVDFLKLCNENGLNLIQKEINDKLIYSYDEKVQHFLNLKKM